MESFCFYYGCSFRSIVKAGNYLLLKAAGLLVLSLTACGELDDSYSTNPGHRLSFSVDTLSFDTVFTTVGSATRTLMVYNRNEEALNIETIRLDNEPGAGGSHFSFNVDGRSGEAFSNIRLEGKDSLYVFIEVVVDPTGEDSPLRIEGHLSFTVNGAAQRLTLQAYGQDVNLYKGGLTIIRDTMWTAERPYLIYDSIVVGSGATLTIAKGATFYMHDKARWVVKGAIKATGTMEEPVVFRGDRLDNLMTDLPYDRVANQWDGLYFEAGSFGNEMSHVIVRNGNGGLCFAESTAGESKLKISDSQVTNMEQSVMTAANCLIEAINTEFSNATGYVMSLSGGDYHFIHCTLANYYIIKPGRLGLPVLRLANYTLDNTTGEEAVNKSLRLNAVFDNCLIDGNFSEGNEPLKGELSVDVSGSEAMDFLFNHCAVKTKQTDDARFINTRLINKDNAPVYKSTGSSENGFSFNFRPDTAKVVIGLADPAISALYPLDRFGVNRIESSDGPDIGAYEYVPEPEKEISALR
ncbi:MAG: hypothetical protein LBK65_09075 [Tannerellaceae bacterium]|jgi:hypothetical protein|nr:hypothetical protein [Tannerellaceae bacterium]